MNDPRDLNECLSMYDKYSKGLPSDKCSLKKICRSFNRRRDSVQQYTYVRMIMRRRGLWPKRLMTEPGELTGEKLEDGVRLLEEGDKLEEAFHVFTCCMVDEPSGTKEHAYALLGRSRVMYSMGRYEESLDNVKRAIDAPWGPPDDLMFDLIYAGGLAMDMLGRGPEMATYFDRALRIMDKFVPDTFPSPEATNAFRDQVIKVIKDRGTVTRPQAVQPPPDEESYALLGARHEQYPAFSEYLEFRHTPDMGLGVFTTRDLEPGNVIAVEDAFIGIPMQNNFYICHNAECQQFNTAVILCNKCTSVYYCSKICFNKDNRDGGHKFECPVLRSVRKLPGHKKINQLALKWFLRESAKMGLDEYCSTVTMLSKSKVDPLTRNKIKEGKYDDFVAAYSMEILNTSSSEKRLLYFNCIVVEMIQLLLMSGHKIPDIQIPTVGASLVHMLQVLDTNSRNFITQSSTLAVATNDGPMFSNLLFSLYPSISQLNHSCDSNVMIKHLQYKRTLALKASRPIPRDSQILISYGQTFLAHHKTVRNAYLQNHFGFKCVCQACEENWPTFRNVPSSIDSIRIINPEMSLDIVQAECKVYDSIKNELEDMATFLHCFSRNEKYLSSFIKFLHANVERPFYLFEHCHDCIIRQNGSYSFPSEYYNLFKLMAKFALKV